MELTTIIARNGAKLIGDIAAKKAWDAQEKALQETDPLKRAKYEREVKQWSEGGVNKIALHSVLGGFVSSLAGGTISTGALSAGANEALQGQLGKIEDPNIHRLASVMIGRVVTQSATGGAIAENGTTHNYLTHKQIEQRRKELAAAQTEEERKAIKARWDAVDELQEDIYQSEVDRLEDKYIKDDIDEIEPDKYIPLKREKEKLKEKLDYVSLNSEHFFNEEKDLVVYGRRVPVNSHNPVLHNLYRDITIMNVNAAKVAVLKQGYKNGTKEYDDALLQEYKLIKERNQKFLSSITDGAHNIVSSLGKPIATNTLTSHMDVIGYNSLEGSQNMAKFARMGIKNTGSILGVGLDIGEDIYQYNQDMSKAATATVVSLSGAGLAIGIGNKLDKVDPVNQPIKAAAVGVGIGATVSVATDRIKPVIINTVEDGINHAKYKVQEVMNRREESNND